MTINPNLTIEDAGNRARCDHCNRRFSKASKREQEGWNVVFRMGVLTGFVCPHCQTPEDRAEAVINEATLDYESAAVLPDGRVYTKSKIAP